MAYDIITIIPTLSLEAYSASDVIFTSTLIKLPHSKCKIINIDAVWQDTGAATDEFTLMFFKENTHQLGTINTAVDISAAEIKVNGFLGASRLANVGETALGTPSLFASQTLNDIGATSSDSPDVVLVGGGTRNTCFVQGFFENDTITAESTDQLVITLHVEY